MDVFVVPDEIKKSAIERYGPGTVTLCQCQICGGVKWQSTHTTAETKVVVEAMTTIDECGICIFMSQRNPEIMRWVIDVIGYQVRRALATGN